MSVHGELLIAMESMHTDKLSEFDTQLSRSSIMSEFCVQEAEDKVTNYGNSITLRSFTR